MGDFRQVPQQIVRSENGQKGVQEITRELEKHSRELDGGPNTGIKQDEVNTQFTRTPSSQVFNITLAEVKKNGFEEFILQ